MILSGHGLKKSWWGNKMDLWTELFGFSLSHPLTQKEEDELDKLNYEMRMREQQRTFREELDRLNSEIEQEKKITFKKECENENIKY